MEASIGIMAHNEEANIGRLLQRILEEKPSCIKEIIVVDDGSTDSTAKIVKKIHDSRIRLIRVQKRSGKANAINLFLRNAKCGIVLIESADTIPENGAIEKLLNSFKDPKIGIAGARAVPVNKGGSFADFFGRFTYQLHHKISLKNPKFGELIAFRNAVEELPDTYVDEEYIAMMIKRKGYKLVYCPESVFFNKQPEKIKEIVSRRTRNCIGHLELRRKGYHASTSSLANIFPALIRCFEIKKAHYIILSVILELHIRALARMKFRHGKREYAWKMAETTKTLGKPEALS